MQAFQGWLRLYSFFLLIGEVQTGIKDGLIDHSILIFDLPV